MSADKPIVKNTERLISADRGSQQLGTEGSFHRGYDVMALDTLNVERYRQPVQQIVSYDSPSAFEVKHDGTPDGDPDIQKDRRVIATITEGLDAVDATLDNERSHRHSEKIQPVVTFGEPGRAGLSIATDIEHNRVSMGELKAFLHEQLDTKAMTEEQVAATLMAVALQKEKYLAGVTFASMLDGLLAAVAPTLEDDAAKKRLMNAINKGLLIGEKDKIQDIGEFKDISALAARIGSHYRQRDNQLEAFGDVLDRAKKVTFNAGNPLTSEEYRANNYAEENLRRAADIAELKELARAVFRNAHARDDRKDAKSLLEPGDSARGPQELNMAAQLEVK